MIDPFTIVKTLFGTFKLGNSLLGDTCPRCHKSDFVKQTDLGSSWVSGQRSVECGHCGYVFALDDSNADAAIIKCIESHESFVEHNVDNMGRAIGKLEMLIESRGMTCRVVSRYRFFLALGLMLIPTDFTLIMGILVLLGFITHKMWTLNPDYTIKRNLFNGSLEIVYNRKELKLDL
jgi:hypothetical protein